MNGAGLYGLACVVYLGGLWALWQGRPGLALPLSAAAAVYFLAVSWGLGFSRATLASNLNHPNLRFTPTASIVRMGTAIAGVIALISTVIAAISL